MPTNLSAELRPVELLIFQGTSFCNIDCAYCYLPNRNSSRRIELDTIAATCRELEKFKLASERVSVLWHAGEPLVLPLSFYESAFPLIRTTLKSSKVDFAIQTNGTLLNTIWLDFMKRWDVTVGLSCDGPARFHDAFRTTRNGEPTSQKVIRAARLIKSAGLPLSVICVLTKSSVGFPEELFRFFEDLGVDELAFNIDEKDGSAARSTFSEEDSNSFFSDFLQRYFELVLSSGSKQRVRELENGLSYLLVSDHAKRNLEIEPIRILTVGSDGGVSTFSPELHGVEHQSFGRFIFANVRSPNWLETLVNNQTFKKVKQDIHAGRDLCRKTCSYFDICLGGSPSNKLGENESFVSTETIACRFYQKAVANVTSDIVAKAAMGQAPTNNLSVTAEQA